MLRTRAAPRDEARHENMDGFCVVEELKDPEPEANWRMTGDVAGQQGHEGLFDTGDILARRHEQVAQRRRRYSIDIPGEALDSLAHLGVEAAQCAHRLAWLVKAGAHRIGTEKSAPH